MIFYVIDVIERVRYGTSPLFSLTITNLRFTSTKSASICTKTAELCFLLCYRRSFSAFCVPVRHASVAMRHESVHIGHEETRSALGLCSRCVCVEM